MEQGVMRLPFHFSLPLYGDMLGTSDMGVLMLGSQWETRGNCVYLDSVSAWKTSPAVSHNMEEQSKVNPAALMTYLWDLFINMKQNPKHTPNFRNLFTLFKTLLAFMESFPSFYREWEINSGIFKMPVFHGIARFKVGWVCALVLLGGILA